MRTVPGGGGRGSGHRLHGLDGGGRGRALGLEAVERLVEAREKGLERDVLREGGDEPHVGEEVVLAVEAADVVGRHLADRGRVPARAESERVRRAVDVRVDLAPEAAVGPLERADHLVVDGPLLLEPERAVGVGGDAEVADLAAHLLVGVVGVEERVHARLEDLEEDVGPGAGVEVVGGAPLLGVGARAHERHVVEARHRAPLVALAEQEVLLGVRLALVRRRVGRDPQVGLRDGLQPQVVEDEARADMDEAGAEWRVGVVEIDGLGAEAVKDLSLGERLEHRGLRSRRHGERREQIHYEGGNWKRFSGAHDELVLRAEL